MNANSQERFYAGNEQFLVAVDNVVFGFEEGTLKLLLFKRKVNPFIGMWSLIGRFVKPEESCDEAAHNVLEEYTGLRNIFLEQVQVMSKVKRDPGARVISIVYYSMIRISEFEKNTPQKYNAAWFDIDKLPELVMDHSTMVEFARQKLINKTQHYPIGAHLLPSKFTLPQLFQFYQAINLSKLDDRNFRKKILAMGILKKLSEKDKSTSKKGAYLYKFDKQKYNKMMKEGYDFKI